jgi:hypothetical protein
MSNNENPSYINENGKKVSGAAAQQHTIKQNGGWHPHHEKFGESILKKFVSQFVQNSQILKPEEQRLHKSNILQAFAKKSKQILTPKE